MLPFPPAEGEGTFGGAKVVKLGVGPRVPHASRRDRRDRRRRKRLVCTQLGLKGLQLALKGSEASGEACLCGHVGDGLSVSVL